MVISAPEPLNGNHDLRGFSCGKASLDRWLRTRALSNQESGFAAVMVVHEAGRVIGYYGHTAIIPAQLARKVHTPLQPDPVPCLFLAQLATNQSWAGRGIGTRLLRHALECCVIASELIDGRALLVSAVDEDAARFWQRWGFIRSKDDPLTLFRSIADIAASLGATRQ